MRLFSEERRSGSLDLLLSAPASLTEIVLGKFFGLVGFMLVLLGLVALMPLSLAFATPLDLGRVAAGVLGLFLIMSAFGAAGLFMSSLTDQLVASCGWSSVFPSYVVRDSYAKRSACFSAVDRHFSGSRLPTAFTP